MADTVVYGQGPTETPVPAADGGTGTTGVTGILKGNGTSDVTAAVAGTDYLTPTGNGSGLTSMVNSQISGSAASGANSDVTATMGFDGKAFSTRECDFTNTSPLQEAWATVSMASGTLVPANIADANHIGVNSIASSTSTNSGWRFNTGSGEFLISGGEQTVLIFKTPAVIDAGSVIRYGFQDSITSGEPVDGVYVNISSTTLKGDCMSNASETVTASTYTLAVATWYRVGIEVNTAATLVTFTLKNMGGTVLWTDTISTNIPTGAGRATGHMLVAYNTGTTAVTIITLDYMNLTVARTLVR